MRDHQWLAFFVGIVVGMALAPAAWMFLENDFPRRTSFDVATTSSSSPPSSSPSPPLPPPKESIAWCHANDGSRRRLGWKGRLDVDVDVGTDSATLRCACECASPPTLRCSNCFVPKPPHKRILCWVPMRDAHGESVRLLRRTWGRHCDALLFTSTLANYTHGVVALPVKQSRSVWNILHPGWTFIAERLAHKYGWFVKMDDDTVAIMENLHHYLRDMDPVNDHHYFGHVLYYKNVTRFAGGAAEVLSRKTLLAMAPFLPSNDKSAVPLEKRCSQQHTWAEDVVIVDCMRVASKELGQGHESMGHAEITRDRHGRERFMLLPPEQNLLKIRSDKSNSWYWHRKGSDVATGVQCCASLPVVFHWMRPSVPGMKEHIYGLEYLMYGVAVGPREGAVLDDVAPKWARRAVVERAGFAVDDESDDVDEEDVDVLGGD